MTLAGLEARLKSRRGLVALWVSARPPRPWSRCSCNAAACPAGTTPPTPTRSSSFARGSRSSGTTTGTAVVRRHQLRLRLLLARPVHPRQGPDRRRRRGVAADELPLPARHVAHRRRLARVGVCGGRERVPRPRATAIPARARPHRRWCRRPRPRLGAAAALLVAVAVYANPMAFVVCGPLMLADVLGRPECRRRYLRFFAVLAPFVLVRLLLGWAFSEPSAYLNETSQLMLYLGFALAGLALAGVNAAHPRRPFLILFVSYSAICVLSFVTPGSPLGNNIGRFFFVFGLPLLLLLRHTRLKRPFPYGDLAVIPIVLFALLQVSAPYSHFTRTDEWPQAAPRSLRRPLGRWCSTMTRTTASTWSRSAGTGRRRTSQRPAIPWPGWYRQADAIHTASSTPTTTPSPTLPGCATWGWSTSSSPTPRWTPGASEGQLPRPPPPSRGGGADRRLDHLQVAPDPEPLRRPATSGPGRPPHWPSASSMSSVTAAGDYTLKFSWSPYWTLEGGGGWARPLARRLHPPARRRPRAVHRAIRRHAGAGRRHVAGEAGPVARGGAADGRPGVRRGVP